jgi:hypothetical protein
MHIPPAQSYKAKVVATHGGVYCPRHGVLMWRTRASDLGSLLRRSQWRLPCHQVVDHLLGIWSLAQAERSKSFRHITLVSALTHYTIFTIFVNVVEVAVWKVRRGAT